MEKIYLYIYKEKKTADDIINVAKELFHKNELFMTKDENGKPFLNDGIYVSISHTKQLYTFGLSRFNFGIDLEEYRDIDYRIVDRIFSKNEKDYFLEQGKTQEAYTEIWTRKEAYIKYDGQGMKIIKSIDTFDEKIKDFFVTIKNNNYLMTIFSNAKFQYEIKEEEDGINKE